MIIATNRNPRLNANISPLLNAHINPRLNAQINPLLNAQINPLLNAQINPLLNAQINPLLNSNINPLLNININPTLNFNYFSGLYNFDLNLNPIEFAIQANSQVIHFFDFSLKNTKFGVKHSRGGYVLFNRLTNVYIGHLESDSQIGYNEFTTTNQWTSFVK